MDRVQIEEELLKELERRGEEWGFEHWSVQKLVAFIADRLERKDYSAHLGVRMREEIEDGTLEVF